MMGSFPTDDSNEKRDLKWNRNWDFSGRLPRIWESKWFRGHACMRFHTQAGMRRSLLTWRHSWRRPETATKLKAWRNGSMPIYSNFTATCWARRHYCCRSWESFQQDFGWFGNQSHGYSVDTRCLLHNTVQIWRASCTPVIVNCLPQPVHHMRQS